MLRRQSHARPGVTNAGFSRKPRGQVFPPGSRRLLSNAERGILDEEPCEYDDEPLSEEDIRAIEESYREIERGEIYPLEEVLKELEQRKKQGRGRPS